MADFKKKDQYTGTWNGKEVRFNREFSGYRFTDEECEKLCNGEEIEIHGFKRKNGDLYAAKGKLSEQEFNGHTFIGFDRTCVVKLDKSKVRDGLENQMDGKVEKEPFDLDPDFMETLNKKQCTKPFADGPGVSNPVNDFSVRVKEDTELAVPETSLSTDVKSRSKQAYDFETDTQGLNRVGVEPLSKSLDKVKNAAMTAGKVAAVGAAAGGLAVIGTSVAGAVAARNAMKTTMNGIEAGLTSILTSDLAMSSREEKMANAIQNAKNAASGNKRRMPTMPMGGSGGGMDGPSL